MEEFIEIVKNGSVLPKEIADACESIGWNRAEGIFRCSLSILYAYYTDA